MKFKKQDLQNLVWDDHDNTVFEVIEDEQVDTTRWSTMHEMVFKFKYNGLFYATNYSQGATECQDERPYEDEDDEIECYQVVPTEVKVIRYVAKVN